MEKDNTHITRTFVIIAGLFVCFLMLANLMAGRLIEFQGLILTGDLLLFPITYIFGDVLTEVWGFKKSRLVIWLGMLANIIMVGYTALIIALPYPSDFVNNQAYQTVVGTTPLIVLASICAYFAGEFINSSVLSIIKKVTKGKYLFVRTIGSTVLGQVADTLVFMGIAFSFLPSDVFWQMVIVQYVVKVAYEVLATPLTYLVVNYIKKKEKQDKFDYNVKYNPFSLEIK